MFVGHYCASLIAKSVDKNISLGTLFVAAQVVDIAWALLVLFGIEKIRFVPGLIGVYPIDLHFMPYTHSLPASVLWAIAAAATYKLIAGRSGSWRGASIVGAVVLSHWVLDLIVHRPDLPLWDNAHKVGMGLWHFPLLSFLLEAALLLGATMIYLRATTPVGDRGRHAMPLFCAVMLLMLAGFVFGPVLQSVPAIAISALITYVVLAFVAYRLDRLRR